MNDSLRAKASELERITGGSTECGWMCDAVCDYLYSLVRFHRPELVIQTGHLWGKSALYILQALQDADYRAHDCADRKFTAFVNERMPSPKSQWLVSIDPKPMGVPNYSGGLEFLSREFPAARIDFVKMTSASAWPTIVSRVGPMLSGMLMGVVDGDHTDEGCRADIEALANLNAEVIFVDDTLWIPSLLTVCEKFASKNPYRLAQHNIYNGIAVLTHV